MSESPSPRQRQTQAARSALASKFPSPEAKASHYRALAAKTNAGRITLSVDEARALSEAYSLLRRIAARHPEKLDPSPEPIGPTDEQAA